MGDMEAAFSLGLFSGILIGAVGAYLLSHLAHHTLYLVFGVLLPRVQRWYALRRPKQD